ncbi:hypothetical protein [Sarcina ventriculi]|nr:hypothetical protein [Sarcina ventriculi]MBU5323531.1 hypothetical protein [Sarcina ventriculi]
MKKDEDGYFYLDKQTYEYILIGEEDIKEIRKDVWSRVREISFSSLN